jgi:general stress protein 26
MMNELMTKATTTLYEEIGQNKIMTLATRRGDGVAARTVNVYSHNGHFYFVTEENSNKYKQLTSNSHVALSVDAIQITGRATPLAHPCDESNCEIAHGIEEKLSQQFARYKDTPIMRLIEVTPADASFILLKSGEGFIIDFSENTAIPIRHDM